MNGNENIIFDSQGRIIEKLEPVSGLFFKYEYLENGIRITTVTNDRNKSNFKTIQKEILINDKYINLETEQHGETYYTFHKYNDKGEEIYFEQTNLKTNKILKKTIIWKDNKPTIWTTDYKGTKGIGFVMSKDKINELKNKQNGNKRK